jgi:ubiquinone/menaquinone biosynthesis C-methylase UbiE
MKKETIDLLINPYNMQLLHYKVDRENEYLEDLDGNKIPIKKGIPNFLVLEKTEGLNKKYQKFYDKISILSDIVVFILSLFMDLDKFRKNWMKDIEIKEGFKVLETSIGSGWNIKVLPENAIYYGLDISGGMLKQCLKYKNKWKKEIELIQGNAEYLPFKNETFDCVYHVGGINFFNDRERAIKEMIRVSKPKTKIIIIDETEEKFSKEYQKTPYIGQYFHSSEIDKARLFAPIDLIPENMENIQVKLLDEGKMYQLSFIKP